MKFIIPSPNINTDPESFQDETPPIPANMVAAALKTDMKYIMDSGGKSAPQHLVCVDSMTLILPVSDMLLKEWCNVCFTDC